MDLRAVYDYYSRDDVRDFFLRFGKNREVVSVFRNGSYGTRPNMLVYPQDITAMVRGGALEFHSSLERWSQPMNLRADNYDKLRIGWDLILDLDCKMSEHGKIAAEVLVWALERHGIKNISVKFTGGTGFHIGIPWEAIPKTIDYKPSLLMFPELPRQIGLYLKEYMREKLERSLLKRFSIEELAEHTGRNLGEITADKDSAILDPFKIVDIDPVLISPRHLFRMPYSLNRNTGLVSLPISPGELETFEKDSAHPDLIKIRLGFLDRFETDEAELLVTEAVDWWSKRKTKEEKILKKRISLDKPVPQEVFPPCIKTILEGLADGRKRSVFILITFLKSLKWGWQDIERTILEWNQRNRPPLPDSYVKSQLRWHRDQKRSILPPGCAHEGWYGSFGICKPDEHCGFREKTVKNPLNYPFRRMRRRTGPRPGRNQRKRR